MSLREMQLRRLGCDGDNQFYLTGVSDMEKPKYTRNGEAMNTKGLECLIKAHSRYEGMRVSAALDPTPEDDLLARADELDAERGARKQRGNKK